MQVRAETQFMCVWLGLGSDLFLVSKNLQLIDGYMVISYTVKNRLRKICAQSYRLDLVLTARMRFWPSFSTFHWPPAQSVSRGLVAFFFLPPVFSHSFFPPYPKTTVAQGRCWMLWGCASAYSCGYSASSQWPWQFPLQRTLAASVWETLNPPLFRADLCRLHSWQK